MSQPEFVGYTHEFMSEFIGLYRALPCLWKVSCKGYKDKLMRNRAYDVLIQKLRQVNGRADRDTVVRKINTLRTAFRREYKKVLKSRATAKGPEELYVSSLWYYDLLRFVAEQNDDDEAMKNEESKLETSALVLPNEQNTSVQSFVEKIEPPSPVSSRSSTPNTFHPVILQTEGFYGLEYPSSTTVDLSTSKEIKCTTDSVQDYCTDTQPAYVDVTSKQIVNRALDDHLKTFGLYVASKLKKSTDRQCIIAERIIAEVLSRANLGTLDENTTLTNKPSLRCRFGMSDR